MEIYEVCEAKRIPVTTHCGGATIHNSSWHLTCVKGSRIGPQGALEDICDNKYFFFRNSYARYFYHPKNRFCKNTLH